MPAGQTVEGSHRLVVCEPQDHEDVLELRGDHFPDRATEQRLATEGEQQLVLLHPSGGAGCEDDGGVTHAAL
jgi:hypothetical protein